MKSILTDKTQRIEKKGVDPIDVDDYNNFILLSNHQHPIFLEKHDRRYFPMELNDKKRGNIKYFKELANIINQETADHFYSYLKQYKISSSLLRKIPNTQLKKDIRQQCKTIIELFYDDCLFNRKGEFTTGKDLHFEYKNWCFSNNYKTDGKNRFLGKLKKYIERKSKRINGKKVIGFEIL